jgi:c(7)-type cytochrome triheme protein
MQKKRFKPVPVMLLCLVLGTGVALSAVVAQEKAKPGESVVTFDNPKMKEVGPVQFSHPAHQKALGEGKLDCKTCHVGTPPLFPMKKPPTDQAVFTMEDMKQGKACGKCHNGKTESKGKVVFDVNAKENCTKCHKKS